MNDFYKKEKLYILFINKFDLFNCFFKIKKCIQ